MDDKERKTIRYLSAEFQSIQRDPILSLGCTVGLRIPGNPYHWVITLNGPQDTAYAGGLFYLTADFQPGYPKVKPEVQFRNKIYHLNVQRGSGHICISTLNNWKEGTKMVDVISAIFALFYRQNPDSPYDGTMARQYRSQKAEFDRIAAQWTQQYAKRTAKLSDYIK